jgi:hypothetical protein
MAESHFRSAVSHSSSEDQVATECAQVLRDSLDELRLGFQRLEVAASGASPRALVRAAVIHHRAVSLSALVGCLAASTWCVATRSQSWIATSVCLTPLLCLLAVLRPELLAARTARAEAAADIEMSLASHLTLSLRQVANKLRMIDFDALDIRHANGLSNLVDPTLEARTAARDRLADALGSMDSASLGVAGPRGAGKTTLIAAACAGRLHEGRSPTPLGVYVNAPVRWEARDFIAFLFAEVCLTVERPDQPSRRTYATVFASTGPIVAMAALVLAWLPALFASLPVGVLAATAAPPWWLLSPPVVAIGVGGTLMLAGARLRERLSPTHIELLAARHLRRLRYRETLVDGWAAEAGPMSWLKASRKQERTLAAETLSIPQLTAEYRAFMEAVATERPVIVGIDELDKMESGAEARLFLNDIKSLFGQRNCFYLVSVSEDAMSEFDRRGTPIRTVFESAFDEIFCVELLAHGDAARIIEGRVVGMGSGFIALCHVFGGGLPRELIRTARTVASVTQDADRSIIAVTWTVIRERLAGMERAIQYSACEHVAGNGKQPVVTWLRSLRPLDSTTSLATRWAIANVTADLGRAGFDEPTRRLQQRLVQNLAVEAYHSATVVEFFANISEADADPSRDLGEPNQSIVNSLAFARHDMSRAPHVAWEAISAVRARIGTAAVPYPDPDPLGPDLAVR